MEKIIKRIRFKIQRYFKKHNKTYAVFGKSMGIDSSVVAGLLSNLDGVKPIGAIIPIESEKEDERIAKIVLNHFKTPFLKIDLSKEYNLLAKNLFLSNSLINQINNISIKHGDNNALQFIKQRKNYALGNIKARLRMIALYHIAQLTNGIVIGTGNFSEYMTGFWTLHGDVGDLYPILAFYKTEVYKMAKVLGVPKESIKAAPSDGLNITKNNSDEDQLGLPYNLVDKVIFNYLKDKTTAEIAKISDAKMKKVIKLLNRIANTSFKRKGAMAIKREKD